ncbi:MAG: hypothetical protein WAN93_14565 [Solirubrobacteraceae bacterium]
MTSTVAPSVVFDAVLMRAALSPLDDGLVLAGGVALACEDEPELLELLPHAANVSDAIRAGARNLKAERIEKLLWSGNENDDGDSWTTSCR